MMAFARSNLPASYTLADQYMNTTTTTPEGRPIEASTSASSSSYPVTAKGPDPLSDDWSYDSAIDLFSMNPMMPSDTFSLDVSEDMMNLESKDFANVDSFGQPAGISGFAITDHSAEDTISSGSMSSDHESDDQAWSPTYQMVSPLESPMGENMLSKVQTWAPGTQTQEARRRMAASAAQPVPKHHRWSSSPDLMPQLASVTGPATGNPAATTNGIPENGRKNSRTPSDAGQQNGNPNSRNAAKRAAHNIIEKRYRTNMNAKFVALEKAMSATGAAKTTKGGSASLKKSEILTNAIAYIQELQEENRSAQKELALLKQNLLPGGIWRHTGGKRA